MAVNRTKVLEAAQKFLSKGQFDKAIAEYQKLVAEDPRDVRTLLKIGDLHTRRNKPKDAIEVYQKVAELYAKQGFFLKAVAVYKQILKLEPGHIDSSQRLAKMYEELGLTNDALSTYEQVADAFAAAGDVERALATMTRMVDLDPQNIAVRIKYAEALSRAGKTREAAAAFAAGAQLLKEQGRMDDYVRVVERQFFHDSENLELARELSSLYLSREDPKRALAKLQVCFKADPRDIQTLEMLAEAFRQLGQIPKTVSVLKEIARLHGELGSADARRRTLQRVLDLDPNDDEAREALAGEPPPPKAPPALPPKAPATASASSSGSRSHAMPPPPAPANEVEAEEVEAEEVELEMVEDDGIEIVSEEDEEAEVLIVDDDLPSAGEGPSTDEKSPEALLEEADDLETLGDYEGAERALQQLLARHRDHELAHERLKDLYLATDRRVEAVRELLWLSDFCMERDMERAIQHAQAAYDLAPHAEATKNRLRMLGVDLGPAEPPKEPAEPSHADAQAPSAADAAEAELDAILPALDGAEAAQARSAEEQQAEAAQAPSQASPLDVELSPHEFDAPVPTPRGPVDPQLFALLEEPLRPEDFEGPAEAALPDDVAALLDAPISPDEFDAPPPPRNRKSSLPPNAEELLEAPLPKEEFERAEADSGVPDDFGLSDPRFETSGMMEVDALPVPRKPQGATPAEWVLEDDDSPSMEFAEIGTDEVDLTEYTARAADEAQKPREPAEAAEAAPEPSLRTTVRPDSAEEPGVPTTEEMELEPEPDEAPALAFDETDDFQELPPDSTVPGAPIPDLLLQARPDARIPEPTPHAPSAPEPELQTAVAAGEPVQEEPSTAAEVLEGSSAEPEAPSVHEYVTTPAPDGASAKSADASAFEHATAPAPAATAPAPAATAPVASEPVAEEEDVSPDVQEVLDEADFFASQGLMDEALEVIQEAILIYPSSKVLRARLLEYEAKADAQEEEEEARAAELADDSFDIAEQLANELAEVPGPGSSEEMIDVESVFAQFKKGVAAQISPDDSDTHFDLGIAYKEMGLLEDAIQEFEIAAKNPKRACTALTMVGMCHLEKGNAQEAVAYFERALRTEHRSPAEELALLYEVGNAQELLGNETSALHFFERVASTDRSFRGVSARVDALKQRGIGSAVTH